MNVIEKKKLAYHAKIRGIACRILVEGLNTEIADDDVDRNAKAEALFAEHSEGDIKEALAFAVYANDVADEKCARCEGLGAVPITRCECKGKVVDGVFVHERCENLAAVTHQVCDCVVAGDAKRQVARRAAEPTARVVGKREETLGQRIKEAEERVKKLEARRDVAVAPVLEEIRQLEATFSTYREGRAEIKGDVAARDGEIAAIRGVIADLQRRLSEADAHLSLVARRREERASDLAKFDADHAGLTQFAADLEAKRERIARHHAPKIDKANRTLNRLTYLRGETKVAVRAEDVRVVVK